jgi:hypothetical protein
MNSHRCTLHGFSRLSSFEPRVGLQPEAMPNLSAVQPRYLFSFSALAFMQHCDHSLPLLLFVIDRSSWNKLRIAPVMFEDEMVLAITLNRQELACVIADG